MHWRWPSLHMQLHKNECHHRCCSNTLLGTAGNTRCQCSVVAIWIKPLFESVHSQQPPPDNRLHHTHWGVWHSRTRGTLMTVTCPFHALNRAGTPHSKMPM